MQSIKVTLGDGTIIEAESERIDYYIGDSGGITITKKAYDEAGDLVLKKHFWYNTNSVASVEVTYE